MAGSGFSLLDLVDVEPLTIVDVGAAELMEAAPYHVLAERTGSHIIGFEPDLKACAALNAAGRHRHSYFPFAIGAGGPATLHETDYQLASSLYRPDAALAQHFTNLAAMLTVKRTHKVETHRLDDVVGTNEIDYLKLDVQGGELDALRGAERLLTGTLVIETEVEFLPIYESQPLFADIDRHLRAAGFQLHTLTDLRKPLYTPMAVPGQLLADGSQLMWTNAVYTRDVRSLRRLGRERLLKLAVLLHDLYGSRDFVAHILAQMRAWGMEAPAEAYIRRCAESRSRGA